MKDMYVRIVKPFGDDCSDAYEFSDPKKAIEQWFILGVKNPMCVGIFCKTHEVALELLRCASEMDIVALAKEYKCPYKAEYLIDGINRGLDSNRLVSWEYDTVFPFTFGQGVL